MSRKDYEAIAAALKSAQGLKAGPEGMRQYVAQQLAQTLKADNPRFDKARFLQACGVPQ